MIKKDILQKIGYFFGAIWSAIKWFFVGIYNTIELIFNKIINLTETSKIFAIFFTAFSFVITGLVFYARNFFVEKIFKRISNKISDIYEDSFLEKAYKNFEEKRYQKLPLDQKIEKNLKVILDKCIREFAITYARSDYKEDYKKKESDLFIFTNNLVPFLEEKILNPAFGKIINSNKKKDEESKIHFSKKFKSFISNVFEKRYNNELKDNTKYINFSNFKDLFFKKIYTEKIEEKILKIFLQELDVNSLKKIQKNANAVENADLKLKGYANLLSNLEKLNNFNIKLDQDQPSHSKIKIEEIKSLNLDSNLKEIG